MNRPSHSRRTLITRLAVALLQFVLLGLTAWDKSDTVDETAYIEGAMWQAVEGNYLPNCHAPALPRWGFALGLRIADPTLFETRRALGPWAAHPLYERGLEQMRQNLLAARMATILLVVLAGVLLANAGDRLHPGAGPVVHILWAFSPTVLAHGSLTTLDAWAASGVAICLYALSRLRERMSSAALLVLGLGIGIGGGSKLTALPFAGLAVLFTLALARRGGLSVTRSLGAALLPLLVALTIIWASFGFAVGTVNVANLCETGLSLGDYRFGPVAAPRWIEGWLLQVRRGQVGFLNYLMGETSRTGWPWYYLVVLGVKTTVGGLVLALVSIVARLKRRGDAREVDLALLLYPAMLLVAMSLGNTQAGVRYILPAFPGFLLWLGIEACRLAKRGRLQAAFVIACLTLGTFESVRLHPHHLMFFNVLAGGPERGPHILITSEDWGQDQRRLAEWQRERGVKRLYYSQYSGRPWEWAVVSRQAFCDPRRDGRFALHAVEVHRPKRVPVGCFDWLTQEPPDERIGYSIYIYHVDEARLERLRRGIPGEPFWKAPNLPHWRDRPRVQTPIEPDEK